MNRLLVPVAAVLLTTALLHGADHAKDPVPPALEQEFATLLKTRLEPHPRLWMTADGLAKLDNIRATDPAQANLHGELLVQARASLQEPAPARVLEGRRLLGVSRAVLRRLSLCAYAWRTTHEPEFLARIRSDLQAVIAFSDWHPEHFLDVAEMVTGVALAYDWCHGDLTPEERAAIRAALVAKAFVPGAKGGFWTTGTNNWNQVCHGGLAVAALAVAEDLPEEAARVLARSEHRMPNSLHEYGPDGAYPEGPGYWDFGTTYSALFFDALRTALGRRSPLLDLPGFLASGEYLVASIGPTGKWFNYSDCGSGPGALIPGTLAWVAAERGQPRLWADGARHLSQRTDKSPRINERFLALLPAWSARVPATASTDLSTSWKGDGATPVAFHRTAWTAEATWVGFKGGTPRANHGHMDVGAFVMDARGVRWADDLGMQSYFSLESKGVDLFARTKQEDAPRWKVFRIGAQCHNVLTVDGANQRLAGTAPIVLHAPGRTVVDMTATYTEQLAAARRGVALVGDSLVVQDEIQATPKGGTVRWAMLTRAEVAAEGNHARLTRGGKSLALRVLSPAGVTVETYSTEPPAPTDVANPGTRMVGFRTTLAPDARATLRVVLVPDDAPTPASLPADTLAAW